MRVVTSADDVNPQVQEVVDLPIFNLTTAQDENPDLQFMKEIL